MYLLVITVTTSLPTWMERKMYSYHIITDTYFTFNFCFQFFFILFVRIGQGLQYSNTYSLKFSEQIDIAQFLKLIQLALQNDSHGERKSLVIKKINTNNTTAYKDATVLTFWY